MNEESSILLSTGNVNRPYIVRDIAFATETLIAMYSINQTTYIHY